MPIKRIQLPDGSIKRVEVPDGATDEQILAFVQSKHSPQANKPDFSNVQGGRNLASTEQGQQLLSPSASVQGQPEAPTLEQINRQNRLDAKKRQFAALPRAGQVVVGMGSAVADALVGMSQMTGIGSEDWRQRELGNIEAARSTGWGKGGAFGGDVAMLAIPAAKVSKFGKVGQFAGNMGLGATSGALHGTRDGESRLANMVIAGTAGAAGTAVPRVGGWALRGVRGAIDPFTEAGQRRVAARVLRGAATDANSLTQPAPSAIGGVQRNLAEESLDPGIAQLARQFPQELQGQALQNNLARADAVRNVFEGASKSSSSAIRAARDAAADTALSSLPNAGFVRKIPVRDAIQSAIKNHAGNPAVQKDLREVLAELPDVKTAQQAYNLRKYIDHLLSNNSTKPAIRSAKRELMGVKGEIDDAISEAFPAWRTYLDDYADASKRATQSDVGAAILSRARRAVDPKTGQRVMTANDLAGTVNDIDSVVRGVTKFGPANAANTLTPKQHGLLKLLSDDAGRMNAAETYGKAKGSDTVQNMATQNMLGQIVGGGRVGKALQGSQLAQRLLTPIEKTYGLFGVPDRLKAQVAEALGDPAKARALLSQLNGSDRRVVEDALTRYLGGIGGGVVGGMAPAY